MKKRNYGTPAAWWWIYVAGGGATVAATPPDNRPLMALAVAVLITYIFIIKKRG